MSRPTDINKWGKAVPDTHKIVLDVENARIDASASASQDTVRHLLFQTERIVELANSIVRSGALFAGERIIVLKQGNDFVVLEGNRRVCACQVLLDPSLAPPLHRKRIVPVGKELRSKLSKMEADVAPNRDAAEIIITRRHTQPGIEQWTPIAKQRRIARMIGSGATMAEVMERFQMPKSTITRVMRDHEVLKQAKSLGTWSAEERRRLNSPLLKTNPFTRFFTLKGARKTLEIDFDETGRLRTSLAKPQFSKAIESIARELLLPNDADSERLNTRATPEEVFQKAFKGDRDLQSLLKANAKARAASGRLTAKADKFFESLTCPIQDNRLAQLTKEISSINYSTFKTAATFLLRALLESTLDWCIKKYSLNQELMKQYHTTSSRTQQREPGLEFKIAFVRKHQATIFNVDVHRTLDHWLQTKNIADLVIHGKWATASVPLLETAASTINPFIKNIFDGSALKP
ncbi:MAG: hypothetical protein AABN95_14580 [Acidobacteriota bacterium]